MKKANGIPQMQPVDMMEMRGRGDCVLGATGGALPLVMGWIYPRIFKFVVIAERGDPALCSEPATEKYSPNPGFPLLRA
jgi:hypothetical protein